MNNLEECSKDVPEFSLCGLTLRGKVVECYDADTCKIVLPVQNTLYKFTCRLSGIDTPEMKPKKDKPNRENEIVWAKKARAELLRLICPNNTISFDNLDIKKDEVINILQSNKRVITVKCSEFDKYGRLLVELFDDDKMEKSYNNILVEKEFAVGYDGGKKLAPWIIFA
jgi:endonuclease YncB( thermonuclease family)